ncbi:hypothetical protein [Afipia sp. DC4300-2b1]|uniref:hypothetical protein n=1 Tax=Afipia sp. DC4300-2b1 TaxID=2804672 RepID=UPI003CFAC5DD
MTAKLRIKAKGIEIEWEGEVEYLKNDLPDLISAIVDALGVGVSDDEIDEIETLAVGSDKKFTTAALAAKIQPKSAPELFKVALAKLQLSDKIEPASRAQIHSEMKNAPKFYKPSMRGNLGKTIDGLLGAGEINEPSSGNFALTQSAQELIQTKI